MSQDHKEKRPIGPSPLAPAMEPDTDVGADAALVPTTPAAVSGVGPDAPQPGGGREASPVHVACAKSNHDKVRPSLALWLVAVSATILFKPLFYSGRQHLIIGFWAFVIGLVGLVWLLARRNAIYDKAALHCVAFWLLLKLWQLVPFREFTAFGFGLIYVVLVCLFFLLAVDDRRGVLLQLERIFALLGGASAAVVVLLAIGVELPYRIFEGTVRADTGQFFYIYPGAIVLSSQVFATAWGGSLVRSSGIFIEPGHFGVICGLLSASSGFRFNTWKRRLILLGGLSTFSGAYLAILIVGLAVLMLVRARSFSRRTFKLYALIGVSALFVILCFMLAPAEFQDRVLWNRLEKYYSEEGLIEGRASDNFNDYYNQYISGMQSLIGIGERIEYQASDWRSEVLRYGWVVFLFYILLFYVMMRHATVAAEIKISIFTALLIVGIHRIGYLDAFLVMAVAGAALVEGGRAAGRHGGRHASGKAQATGVRSPVGAG